MKKLKAGLLLLFSMLLSLCLFACTPADPGDDGDEPGTTTGQVTRAAFVDDDNVITLTDAETADEATRTEAFNDAVSELALNLTMSDGSRTRITGDQCDYDFANVTWGTWGTYYATVTPKTQGDVNNAGNVTATLPLEIHIGHAFGEADEDTGEATCSHCGATQTTSSLESGVEGVSYGAFHDENSFENITSGDGYGDLSQIAEFGNAVQGEYETKVYSMTAGRLRKGMSITVTGTALVKNLKNLSETEQNRQWYFPNIGIALREFDASTSPINPDSQYDGGMSVIVRNDGHVLMNGIGNNGSAIYGGRLLAGLVGGSTENFNYGSHTSSSTDEYDSAPWSDYNPGDMPLDASVWNDWSVYSSGTIMRTGDYQGDTAKNIRLTWTFRLDNVVELVYENLTEGTTLVARIKIPDEYANAQFETVLHGDQIDMTFSSVSTIEQEKLESVTFNGLADGAQTVYAANEAFNFADLEDRVTVAYTQGSSATYDDFELQVKRGAAPAEGTEPAENAEGWVTLEEGDPLLATDKDFRIMVSIGSVTAYDTMSVGDDGFISKIIANNVAAAYGYRYTLQDIVLDSTSFDNIGFTGNVDGDTAQVLIAPVGTAAPIPAAASSVYGELAFDYYVALRIWSLDGATFNTITEGLQSNYLVLDSTTDYIDVIVGVDGKSTTVTLTGAQDTDIVIDVSDVTIPVLATEVSVSGGYIPVNEGADVTLTFTVDETLWEGQTGFGFSIIPTNHVRFNELKNGASGEVGGYAYKVVSVTGGAGLPYVVTLTLTIPALTGLSDGTLTIYTSQKVAPGPTTTLYYGAPTGDGVQTMEVGGYTVYFYADGTNLYYYVASAYEDAQLAAADIAAELWLNVNGGAASPDTALEPAFIDIGFRYANGAFVLNDATLAENSVLESSSAVYGTTDNAYDYDVGFFFAGCIDATRYGVTAGDGNYTWYFQLGTSAETANGYTVTYTAAAGKTPASTAIASNADLNAAAVTSSPMAVATFRAGTCVTPGLYGREYTASGTDVVFYANVLAQGGDHSRNGSGTYHSTCEYCGRTAGSENINSHKEGKDVVNTLYTLNDNSYLEFTETYKGFTEFSSGAIFEGVNLTITQEDGSGWYIRSDSYVGYADNVGDAWQNVATNVTHSFDEDGNTALRTPLGKLDPDGNAIEQEDYLATLEYGRLRVIVTKYDGTLTVIWSLYASDADDFESDTPYFTFTVGIPAEGAVTLDFDIEDMSFGRNAGYLTSDGHTGSAVNNLLTGTDATADNILVNGEIFARSTDITSILAGLDATVTGGVASGYANLTLEGAASNLTDDQKTALGIPAGEQASYTKYVALTLNFSAACAPQGVPALVSLSANEGTVYGSAVFSGDREHIDLVVAYNGSFDTLYLDFVYGGAYTRQAVGVALDFGAVSMYDVTTSVANNATAAAGGNVAITYTVNSGTPIPENVIFTVNGAVLAQTADTTVGGVTFVSYDSNTHTLTVTLPSLADYTQAYTIAMYSVEDGEAGDLIASNTVAATQMSTGINGSTVGYDENTLVIVDGNQLTVILAGVASTATEDFWINANMGAAHDDTLFGYRNYGYNVGTQYTNGAQFASGADNATGDTIKYATVLGRGYVVMTIDLAAAGVTGTAPYTYGFELSETGTAVTEDTQSRVSWCIVNVASTGTSLSSGVAALPTEMVTASNSTCSTVGYNGIASMPTGSDTVVFYANLVVSQPSHTWTDEDNDKVYICEDCSAILYQDNMNLTGTGDQVPDNGKLISQSLLGSNLTSTGLTLSFWMNSGSSDWDSTPLATVAGNVHVDLENLQANVTTTKPESVSQELWNKSSNTNFFPGDHASVGRYTAILNQPNSYVTIVVDPGTTETDGVRYYVNGVLTIQYNGNTVSGSLSVGEFVEIFLTAAMESGLYINGAKYAGTFNTEDFILEMSALSEEQVITRYKNYLLENAVYPVHEHSYSSMTDRCACGELNPDHAHRNWTNGVCGICGDACTHEFDSTGACTICDMKAEAASATLTNDTIANWANSAMNEYLLVDGKSVTFTATLSGAGAAFTGINVSIFDSTHARMVFIQPHGNPADGAIANWGNVPNVTQQIAANPEDATFNSFKATATVLITATLANDTLTITQEYFANGTTDFESATPQYTYTVTASNYTASTYYIGVARDNCSITGNAQVSYWQIVADIAAE